jgi:hypothetical protein
MPTTLPHRPSRTLPASTKSIVSITVEPAP